MAYLSEKNERLNRQMAFWLTLGLHLAFAAWIYTQRSTSSLQEPVPQAPASEKILKRV